MSEDIPSGSYALGTSSGETERLMSQAEQIAAVTRQLLVDAGIGPGMAVLDIGSGAGDVSLLARELVGESGSVLGVDSNPTSLSKAEERAKEAGFTNVVFLEGDLEGELPLEREFDALIGRIVLMYFEDPSRIVRSVLKHLRPGGIVAFQESDVDTETIDPPSPLYSRLTGWSKQALRGTQLKMASDLERVLSDCRVTNLHISGPISPIDADMFGFDNRADVMRVLLPRMRQYRVAPPEELDRFEEYLAEARREVIEEHKVVRSMARTLARGRKAGA